MAKKYKVEHDRPNCIGCGACCAVCPSRWEMGEDGKSNFKGNPEIDEAEYKDNKDAADSCPVNVIHIIDQETKKKII